MKGLARDISNELNKYIPAIHIKKRYLLAESRAAANIVSTDDITVEPESKNSSDTQD